MKKDPIKHAVDLIHAHTLRSMLAHCNTNIRTLVTRGELASALRKLGSGVDFDLAIELLTREELQAGRLPCTAVVIDADTRQPCSAFFTALRDAGLGLDGRESELTYWQEVLSELGVVPHTLAELYQARSPSQTTMDQVPMEHPLRRGAEC